MSPRPCAEQMGEQQPGLDLGDAAFAVDGHLIRCTSGASAVTSRAAKVVMTSVLASGRSRHVVGVINATPSSSLVNPRRTNVATTWRL